MDATAILDAARRHGFQIAVAESCTGGMLAAALTDPPGASDVFRLGIVAYSNHAKISVLGVSPATLAAQGAVSQETAAEMAEGVLRLAGAHLAVSITGIAGPGGSDHKPEGRVCFALVGQEWDMQTETVEFGPLGREKVRAAATGHALGLLARALA